MTKEEIREEIAKILLPYIGYAPEEEADEILTYLDSCGVVLKVDGELPDLLEHQRERLKEVPEHADMRSKAQDWLLSDCLQIIRVTKNTQKDMLKAGYVKTERLI